MAQADWLFTPSLAYPFGGDTLGRHHPAFAFGAGWVDDDGFGLELDAGFAPRFFEGDPAVFSGRGNVFTAMANVLLAGAGESRVRPYLSGGAGYMQMRVTSDNGTFKTTTTEPGLNAGAGVLGFFGEHVGIRADVRYIRSFRNQEPSWTRNANVNIAPGACDFFRAAIGVTIRVIED